MKIYLSQMVLKQNLSYDLAFAFHCLHEKFVAVLGNLVKGENHATS